MSNYNKINEPNLWRDAMPQLNEDGHKYDRGHAVVFGGARMTGAARMASEAAMRIGAGLCTIVAPDKDSMRIYQEAAPHIIVELYGATNPQTHWQDARRTAFLLGSGYGQDAPESLKALTLDLLAARRKAVLDADALTVFAENPEALCRAVHSDVVITPHEGEFAKIFPDIAADDTLSRTEKALAASRKCEGVVVLKGPQTVIAKAGHAVLNDHAAPDLATAGAGDVLAGMILGLIAQGMEPFAASCAAVWMHGEAGIRFGHGLVAPDIIQKIPDILRDFT